MTLKQIEKKIKGLKKIRDKIEKDLGKLQGQKIDLTLNEIKTNGLKEQPWRICIDSCHNISLVAYVKDRPILEKLSREFSYRMEHYEIVLDSSEFIRFDDGKITIHFKDINQCVFFIKKYGLSLDFSQLENNRQYYSDKLDFQENIWNTLKEIK